MIRKSQWHVRSKWSRHLGLSGSRRLARYIPSTRLLSRRNLKPFLRRHKIVFVKPVYGSFGNRIMKVARRKHGGYSVHREHHVRRVSSRGIVRTVFRHTGRRPFLIQKGVNILKVKRRPVDFRVLLLRPGSRWETMGIMGKMATGNRIVTNYNHGGRAVNFKELLRRAGWSPHRIDQMEARMIRIGRAAANKFSRRYKHCRRLGIDMAIDTEGRVWILEVNTNPFFDLFRHHENKHLYERIKRTMRQIRRNQSNR